VHDLHSAQCDHDLLGDFVQEELTVPHTMPASTKSKVKKMNG
jgi:hypothetical protein